MDVRLVGTRLDASHEVEPEQFEPGIPDQAQPRRHVLDLELADATLAVSAGLAERWNLELELPFRRVAVDVVFLDADGRPLPGFESIHHRTETISGLADVALWTLYRPASSGAWDVGLRGGLTAPTGETEPDPFELGERGESHQHLFFGSGTWDPQIGVDASRAVTDWRLHGWLRARLPVTVNADSYRGGGQASGGLGGGRPIGSSGWSIRAQVEMYHEEASSWRGRAARNSGRTDLVLGLGGGFRPAGSPWAVYGLLRLPENLRARGGQVDLAPILALGVSVTRPRGLQRGVVLTQ